MSEKRINQALDILKDSGYKYTKRREEILSFLEKEDKYIAPKEVYDYMSAKYAGISYDTIYRNLSDFSTLNILEETEFDGEKKYRFHCGHGHVHHHHFICTYCGATQALEMCPMDFFEEQLKNVQIEGHRFEIFGKCENCIKKEKNLIKS